jgi:hypothetical protein
MKNVYNSLARKPQKKRPLGKCMHGLEDNIEMDVGEMCESDSV